MGVGVGDGQVKVGIVQMPVETWPDTAKRAQELEAMGFAHLWMYDHLSWRHYQDHAWHATMPWLAAIACSTERIRIGTMVASPNLRHPLTAAKDAMTLDHISGGRFILGLGAGTAGFDATVFGEDALSPGRRADRLAEYLEVTGGLLAGTLTNHSGPWYTMDEGRVEPGCVQQPRLPIALAAGGSRTIDLAARAADQWITLGDTAESPADLDQFENVLAGQLRLFVEGCERYDRDPGPIGKICFVPSAFGLPMSSFESFADLAGRVAALGFTDIVVHDRRPADPALDYDPDLIPAIADWHQAH
jgi:alkanesulfonate monooxygenase SsuD/methylene tetrahydromethanopterin reductase-like flavin-dependent oxidoreductase (luciferase family)